MSAERVANFCPRCGHALVREKRFGRERPVCPRCNYTMFFEPKVAVVAFITEQDRVLLIRRSNPPAQGLWALPAGFVDCDEDPREAIVREACEETGLVVEVDALMDVMHRPDEDGLADIVIAYQCHAVGGSLCADDDADEVGWFRRDALPDIGLVTTQNLIDDWRADGS